MSQTLYNLLPLSADGMCSFISQMLNLKVRTGWFFMLSSIIHMIKKIGSQRKDLIALQNKLVNRTNSVLLLNKTKWGRIQ